MQTYTIPKAVGNTCVKSPRGLGPLRAGAFHRQTWQNGGIHVTLLYATGGASVPRPTDRAAAAALPFVSDFFSKLISPPSISGATEACPGGGLSRAASPSWPRPTAAAVPRRRGSCPPRRPPLALASWGGSTCPSPPRFGARSTPPFPSAAGAAGAGWLAARPPATARDVFAFMPRPGRNRAGSRS